MSRHHTEAGWTSALSAMWRKRLATTLPAPCTLCSRLVYAEQAWQVDHIVPLSLGGVSDATNLGPAHRGCNAKAGGRLGAAKTNARRKDEKRLPKW